MPPEDSQQLLFAPFKGITNKYYRNAFARHFDGFDQMYTPFVSGIGNNKVNPELIADFYPPNENLSPTVPQIISNDHQEIILFGKTLQDLGFDHINWNLGCPFSRIANKKRGCGILPFPGELDRILDQVFNDFPIKLSVKTRLGYYNKEEIKKILEVLNRYPVHLLILHPRIGTQVYSGEVDLEGFSSCLAASRIPMVYNGDIYHSDQFRKLQALFPEINTWMIGRGALINPFLPQQIKGITNTDGQKRIILKKFHAELLEKGRITAKNDARLLGSMKAIWYYMSGAFYEGREVFSGIKKSLNFRAYHKAVELALQQPFADTNALEAYFKKGIKHIGN